MLPTQEQLTEWDSECFDEGKSFDVMMIKAFQAGADQELEACCEWIAEEFPRGGAVHQTLRKARRPKPPSLKEQALCHLESFAGSIETLGMDSDLIRRALEALPD